VNAIRVLLEFCCFLAGFAAAAEDSAEGLPFGSLPYLALALVAEAVGEMPSGFCLSFAAFLQGLLQRLRILRSTKQRISILNGLSGTIKPGRLTLLLGPPSSGKTTLLKAISGKLRGAGLKVGTHLCMVS